MRYRRTPVPRKGDSRARVQPIEPINGLSRAAKSADLPAGRSATGCPRTFVVNTAALQRQSCTVPPAPARVKAPLCPGASLLLPSTLFPKPGLLPTSFAIISDCNMELDD